MPAAEPLGDVDAGRGGHDRDHGLGDDEEPRDERDAEDERERRDQQDRRRQRVLRARPWPPPPAASGATPRPDGSRGAIQRSNTQCRTLARGPPSAPTATISATPGTSHGTRKTKPRGARPPLLPGRPGRSGRRPLRPAGSPQQPKPDARDRNFGDTDRPQNHRCCSAPRRRIRSMRIAHGRLRSVFRGYIAGHGGVGHATSATGKGRRAGGDARRRSGGHGRLRRPGGHPRRQPDPGVDPPRPALAAAVPAWSRSTGYLYYRILTHNLDPARASRSSRATQMQILLPVGLIVVLCIVLSCR